MIPIPTLWTVPADAHRLRLDAYLSALLPDRSRSQIQRWIRSGHVSVNGTGVKTGYRLRTGNVVCLHPPEASLEGPIPENIPLEIIYQDSFLAVVNKKAGMVCHAGAGSSSGTLVNALLYHFAGLETGDVRRPGIVHRLDKNTSGLLVVAKDAAAHRRLALQFKNREVRKEYLALVYGTPRPAEGTIDWPLGRDTKNRKKFSIRARRRRAALTYFSVEKSWEAFSLLRVRIATGRTHQIRVHLAQLGHPVVGDELYGAGRRKNLAVAGQHEAVAALRRHLLHACRLEFRHPATDEPMSFVSPMPPDMQDFLAML